MPHDEISAGAALAALELLATEAPIGEFGRLASQVRLAGVTGPELARAERAAELGLDISAQLDRHRRREAGYAALVDVARDLTAAQGVSEVVRIVARRARSLLSADIAYVLFAGADGTAELCAADGNSGPMPPRIPVAAADGMILTGPAPFATTDYLHDPAVHGHRALDEAVRREGIRAVLGIPLRARGHRVGALYVAERRVRRFSADEVSLLTSFGDLAGISVERARSLDLARGAVSELEKESASEAEATTRQRELTRVHADLVELVLSGAGADAVAAVAARQLGCALLLCTVTGSVVATVGDLPGADRAVEPALVTAGAAGELVPLPDRLWAAPVCAGDERVGLLLLRPPDPAGRPDDRLVQLVTQSMAVLLVLEDSRTSVVRGPAHDDLLDDLLARTPADGGAVLRRAGRVGLDLTAPHVVLVARPVDEALGRTGVWAAYHAHRLGGLGGGQDGQAVLVLPGGDPAAAARAVEATLAPLLGRAVTVTGSGPATDPAGLAAAYREALRCLNAMVTLGAAGRSASTRELGLLGLLLSDRRDLGGFVEAVLGPVLRHDEQQHTELTLTLAAYLDSGRSVGRTAARLHVHANTVARRLERIRQLLGPDWQDRGRALDLHLAVRLHQVRGELQDRPTPSAGGPGGQDA